MAFFADEGEVYEYIGGLFEALLADPVLLQKFRSADTVVQYRMHDPEAVITVHVPRAAGAPRLDLGPTGMQPEVVMEMQADIAHRFWLGQVNVTVALARGQITARGPVTKILRLIPLMKPSFPRYRARLHAAGRDDLVQA